MTHFQHGSSFRLSDAQIASMEDSTIGEACREGIITSERAAEISAMDRGQERTGLVDELDFDLTRKQNAQTAVMAASQEGLITAAEADDFLVNLSLEALVAKGEELRSLSATKVVAEKIVREGLKEGVIDKAEAARIRAIVDFKKRWEEAHRVSHLQACKSCAAHDVESAVRYQMIDQAEASRIMAIPDFAQRAREARLGGVKAFAVSHIERCVRARLITEGEAAAEKLRVKEMSDKGAIGDCGREFADKANKFLEDKSEKVRCFINHAHWIDGEEEQF